MPACVKPALFALPLVCAASAPALAEPGVADYRARIAAIDDSGPMLGAVIALNPDAEAQEAAARKIKGPLAGRAVLIKDNIETRDRMPTTAGSLALKDNVTGRDAPLVGKLRASGVVILGKTNLSEWANIRSEHSVSGWSAVGGQVRNPHALDRSPCGSSSGSGAAVAAGLAWAAIGTETDGSVTCPASVAGIVGLKPTVGLISRTHVVPISHSQDTPGPMTTSVRDAALLLDRPREQQHLAVGGAVAVGVAIDRGQARDGADERRLAGAGGADQADHLATFDAEADAVQHANLTE